ncbi:hypothetical protein AABB24_036527 [Solanum stoloniferum]|uniref:Uncharacterized protein n=1 Tax=Solanum stoloniferum TaxID=62892 RepID=A0ABD2REM5_9SOLN
MVGHSREGVNQIEQQDVQNLDNGFDPNFLEDIFLLDVAHGNPYVVESPLIERQSVVQGPLPEAELIAKNEEEAPAPTPEYEEEALAPSHEEEEVPEYIVTVFPNTEFRFIIEKWLTDSDICKNRLLLPSGDFHKL